MLLCKMSNSQLCNMRDELLQQLDAYKKMSLSLNMTRGKPCKEQLDLTTELFKNVDIYTDSTDEYGVDCRNTENCTGSEDFASCWLLGLCDGRKSDCRRQLQPEHHVRCHDEIGCIRCR